MITEVDAFKSNYGTKKRKKAPRGYHYMPDGRLMKNSAHKKKKKSSTKVRDSPRSMVRRTKKR